MSLFGGLQAPCWTHGSGSLAQAPCPMQPGGSSGLPVVPQPSREQPCKASAFLAYRLQRQKCPHTPFHSPVPADQLFTLKRPHSHFTDTVPAASLSGTRREGTSQAQTPIFCLLLTYQLLRQKQPHNQHLSHEAVAGLSSVGKRWHQRNLHEPRACCWPISSREISDLTIGIEVLCLLLAY